MRAGIRAVAVLGALLTLSVLAEGSEASLQGKKFVSKRYGYEFVFPAGDYAAHYATTAWNSTVFPSTDTGMVDSVWYADTSDRKFIAANTRLPTGTTLRKWEATYLALLHELNVCQKVRASRSTTLGGVAAREFTIPCSMYDVTAVIAIHRGRGYFFQFVSPTSNTTASDQHIFDAGRRTFRFTSK